MRTASFRVVEHDNVATRRCWTTGRLAPTALQRGALQPGWRGLAEWHTVHALDAHRCGRHGVQRRRRYGTGSPSSSGGGSCSA